MKRTVRNYTGYSREKHLARSILKNANRDVKIKGYVETIECDPFVKREKAQISIICPRPYFEALATLYAEACGGSSFEFPFAIEEQPDSLRSDDYPARSNSGREAGV